MLLLPKFDFVRLTKYLVDVPALSTTAAYEHSTDAAYFVDEDTILPPYGLEPPQLYLIAYDQPTPFDHHRAAAGDPVYTF